MSKVTQRTSVSPDADNDPVISDRPTVAVASRYSTLWALDAHTGHILWRLAPAARHPTLIHAGDILHVSSQIPLIAFNDLDEYNGTPIPPGRSRPRIHAFPAEVVALRIGDGTTIWQHEGWSTMRGNYIILDGDLLLSEGPVQQIGEVQIHALDTRTGAIRWTYDAGPPHGLQRRLLAARAGRVYIWHEGNHWGERDNNNRRLDVLDTQTGHILWSKQAAPNVVISDHGTLVALSPAPHFHNDNTQTVHAASDGQQVAALPSQSRLLALSDDGIAYLAGHTSPPRISSAQLFAGHGTKLPPRHIPLPTISAYRLSDGADLWRAENVEAGAIAITAADTLYLARLTQPQERGEVTALDIHTGQLLWRWRTPGNLISLLRLWGTRTPQVLIYAIAQARRSVIRARDYHDRGIITREIINGQWRHPTHLISVIGVHLAANNAAIYVATSLGLFALHPRDGHLLWHALPTSELVQIVASP